MENKDFFYMNEAIAEARACAELDEVPVGAVAVLGDRIIARSGNRKERAQSATRHAEIEVLEQAAAYVGNWYLEGVTIYCTLEPCPMCAGAMINARIDRLVYGAADTKAGCAGSVTDLFAEGLFNHTVTVEGGVCAEECGGLLSDFFRSKRQKNN